MASKVSFTICSFVLPSVEIMNINFFDIKISFLPSGKKDFFGYILSAVGGLGLAPFSLSRVYPELVEGLLAGSAVAKALADRHRARTLICTLDIKLLTPQF